MARIPVYDPKTKDSELLAFVQDVTNIINGGRYSPPVNTSVPSVAGNEGQELLYYDSTKTATVSRYSYVNAQWRPIPLGAECNFGFIEVTAAASATKAVTFANAFPVAPMILVTYIGVKNTAGAPTVPADFVAANTLRSVAGYAPSTTGFTVAIYTGNGSNMNNGEFEGFGWIAYTVT